MFPLNTIKKFFDVIYKRNKTFVVSVICVTVFSIFQISGSIIYKYIHLVDNVHSKIISHEEMIDNLNEEVNRTEQKGIVTRLSFNNYIKRKDTEYHEQMSINNDLYSRIGFLEGIQDR